MPRATVTEAFDIGSGVAPPPPNSGIDGPGVDAVTITTVPESTWVVVHASGSITLVPNPDCHGFCPTTSPTFGFSPTPNVTGPVVVAANTGGPDDFFRMRGSGGAGESGGSAVGLQFVPKGAAIRARINIPESIRGYDPLTGSNVASWLMSGGYGITAAAVPSGIAVTESAPAPDGTVTYQVTPIMDLAFFNPINLVGPSVPQGAITWNYFVADTADQTRPSGATYEITECQFQTECRWKPPAPGRMQVHAYVEMQSVYARSKPAKPEQEPKLVLRCDGRTDADTVMRGSRMSCLASTEPAAATLSALQWQFQDEHGHAIPGPSGDTKQWDGIMVVGGQVQVTASLNGKPASAGLAVTVTPRDWTGKITFPTEPEPEWVSGPPLRYPPIIEGDTLADGTLGQSTWAKPEPAAGYGEGTGPNKGWFFFDQPPYFSPRQSHIYLNNALKPTDPFWRAQTGPPPGQVAMGKPRCGPDFMRQAARHVPAHEHGHYSRAEALAKSPQGAALLESAVHWGDPVTEEESDEMIHDWLAADSAQQAPWDAANALHVPCEFTRP